MSLMAPPPLPVVLRPSTIWSFRKLAQENRYALWWESSLGEIYFFGMLHLIAFVSCNPARLYGKVLFHLFPRKKLSKNERFEESIAEWSSGYDKNCQVEKFLFLLRFTRTCVMLRAGDWSKCWVLFRFTLLYETVRTKKSDLLGKWYFGFSINIPNSQQLFHRILLSLRHSFTSNCKKTKKGS